MGLFNLEQTIITLQEDLASPRLSSEYGYAREFAVPYHEKTWRNAVRDACREIGIEYLYDKRPTEDRKKMVVSIVSVTTPEQAAAIDAAVEPKINAFIRDQVNHYVTRFQELTAQRAARQEQERRSHLSVVDGELDPERDALLEAYLEDVLPDIEEALQESRPVVGRDAENVVDLELGQ